MSNSLTFPSSDWSFSPCSMDGVARNRSSAFNAVALSTSIVIAFLSPLAVVGNSLVMAAIWRNTSLRTPSYIILCGLAFTDLCTGVITEPFYVAVRLMCLHKKNESYLLLFLFYVTAFCNTFFAHLSLVLVTLMSIERWLHMTRRSLLTLRRSCLIVALISLLLIPVAIFQFYSKAIFILSVLFVVFLLFCLIATTISYFKVFRIIRRHQQQVQANENSCQPSIDILKYKKSMTSILYILGVFYVSYSPYLVVAVLFILKGYEEFIEVTHVIFMMFLFLSTSLNPVIYIYRMNDVRNEVKNLVRKLFCM